MAQSENCYVVQVCESRECARCAVGKESIGACLGLLIGLSLVGSVCERVSRRHCSEDFLVSASDDDGKARILTVQRIRAHLW